MNKKMFRQAQEMQKNMLKVQEELDGTTVEATAGGGAVTAVVSGNMRLESVVINPDVVSQDDVVMLQDLIIAAVREAQNKAQEMVQVRMSALTGGINIPGLM